MSPEERRAKVRQLFKQISFIADAVGYKHTSEVDKHIKLQVEELWEITKVQRELMELPKAKDSDSTPKKD
jgi:hypothetical protein